MFKLFIFLVLGLVAGILLKRFVKTTGWFTKFLQKFQLVLLFLMLFLMGYRIGRDRGMLQSLPELGLQSVVIAIASVAGGLLFTFLFVKLFRIKYVTNEKYRHEEENGP